MSIQSLEDQLGRLTERLDENVKFLNESSKTSVALEVRLATLTDNIREVQNTLNRHDGRLANIERNFYKAVGALGAITVLINLTVLMLKLIQK